MDRSFPSETQAAPSLWLVSFADLTAILVAFFVLMYAMSLPVPQLADGRVSGVRAAAAGGGVSGTAGQGTSGPHDPRTASESASADLTLGYLSAVFADRSLAARDGTGPVVQSMDPGRGVLVVAFDGAFLFEADGTAIRPLARAVLADIATLLNRTNNSVRLLVPVVDAGWSRAFDQADTLFAGFRAGGYQQPVDRMVSPGVPGQQVQILISHGEGA